MASYSTKPAISLFDDVTFYFDVVGADDGANYGYDATTGTYSTFPSIGTMRVLLLDKVSVKRTRTLADHSTANSKYEFKRTVKSTFSITIDTKLQQTDGSNPVFISELVAGAKIVFACVDNSATSHFYGVGIVENFDINYGSPTTMSFTIGSYGTPLTWEELT